ncbi:acyl-CoA synthetase [Actinomadura sp. KC345]|uniref:class I adenylate-forming enzyme family protein n=1 Tax=Actinomadura sp. KC345 TaxID=2530371 RepID=UPI001053D048|nr:class I adenylate-forming enzyme family protein [Actinomadura sp. KC345]TDC51186.1 acyl-CoA synthetase [Actinomadura sp. KC345]
MPGTFQRSETQGPPSPPLDEAVVGDVLRRAARLGPDDPVLTGVAPAGAGGPAPAVWTAAELLADATAVAASLLRLHPPGTRVATYLPNGPEAVLLQFGVALAGMVLVPVNPRSRPDELAHALGLSGAASLYVRDEAAGPAGEAASRLPRLGEVVRLDGDWRPPRAEGPAPALPYVDPDSLAQILFTSGTSGRPKGVRIHHRGMVHTSHAFNRRIGLPPGGVWVDPMPLFHTAGNVLGVMGALWQRAEHVVMRFEPAAVLEAVDARRATLLSAAPTLLHLLMDHPDFPATGMRDLRVVFTGGMTLTPSMVGTIEARFGAPLSVTFGMTETCGCALQTAPLADGTEVRRTTVGTPVEGTGVRVVDAAGEVVPVGRSGELLLRGARLTQGYYGDPEATARAIDADGWLHTGDLAVMDARGRLRIAGRLTDMIKTGGENVAPEEVEEVVTGHPGVARAAVVGVPDARWGELVVAFVVPEPGADFDPDAVTAYCRERLTPFKVPRRWTVVGELPLTASAKVRRAELRRRAAAPRDG